MNRSKFATPLDRAEEVEALIKDVRTGRAGKERVLEALKAAAGDLRARCDGAGGAALEALQGRVANLVSTRTSDGWNPESVRGIGQEVVGRWPVIRQALEKFERER